MGLVKVTEMGPNGKTEEKREDEVQGKLETGTVSKTKVQSLNDGRGKKGFYPGSCTGIPPAS